MWFDTIGQFSLELRKSSVYINNPQSITHLKDEIIHLMDKIIHLMDEMEPALWGNVNENINKRVNRSGAKGDHLTDIVNMINSFFYIMGCYFIV